MRKHWQNTDIIIAWKITDSRQKLNVTATENQACNVLLLVLISWWLSKVKILCSQGLQVWYYKISLLNHKMKKIITLKFWSNCITCSLNMRKMISRTCIHNMFLSLSLLATYKTRSSTPVVWSVHKIWSCVLASSSVRC